MSTYFWNDPYIELLQPLEKLLYVYLCFNQHDNLAGVYLVSRGTMAGETGLTIAQVNEILMKFETDSKVLFRDNIIAVKNRIKNNNLNNTPIRKNILRTLEKVPEWALDFIDLTLFLEKEGISFESLRTPRGLPAVQGKGKGISKGTCCYNAFKIFFDKYLIYRKEKYKSFNEPKEAGLLKNVSKKITQVEYERALDRFHALSDNYVKGNGYNVISFCSKLQGLLSKEKTETAIRTNGLPSADEVDT